MSEHCLVVVDMQNDFVSGSLGSAEARALLPALCGKVRAWQGPVWFTRDTHYADYLQTQEGRLLPVVHCVEGSHGWQLAGELEAFRAGHDSPVYDKEGFGSPRLARDLAALADRGEISSVTFTGVCTDICVVSNALLLKSLAPQLPLFVDPACCAGTSPEAHAAALRIMRSCQILPEKEDAS